MKKLINWKLYWVLMVLIIVSTIMGQPSITRMAGKELTLQHIFLFAVPINGLSSLFAMFLGLYLGKKVGLGAPILEAWVNKEKLSKDKVRFALVIAPVVGLLLSGVTFALSFIPVDTTIQSSVDANELIPTALESFLGAFYGGIFEELTSRLFIMTLYVWLFSFIISKIRRKNIMPSKIAIWIGIVLAGLIFGLAHLVTASQMMELTPSTILVILLGNGIPGIVFGILYWKKGIESSIVAHFTGDIIIHMVPMLFLSL